MGQLWGVVKMSQKQSYIQTNNVKTEDSLTYGMNATVNLVAKQTQEMDKLKDTTILIQSKLDKT